MLHPELEKYTILLGRFTLSHLLLMNDANYPWFVLVPDRKNITEIYQLDERDQRLLIHESSTLAEALAQGFHADKINIAALGNVVPQLHVHHIVRYHSDPAWPAAVWGKLHPVPYSDKALHDRVDLIKAVLDDHVQFIV
jgi:diadenosine tetraphosphate (Ap4A) HIT family hydrolase